MTGKRSFGSLRRLPSTRWQARYTAPDGREHRAPVTFDTRRDADAWLSAEWTKIQRQEWVPPAAVTAEHVAKVATYFAEYATEVLDRRNLRDTTRHHYGMLLKRTMLPTFGRLTLAQIDARMVQKWYATLRSTPTLQANAYGLLKSILKDAVEDELIDRNPCRIRAGSSKTRAREPEALTATELTEYLFAVPDRFRVPLMLAGWCALRSGEVRGLRRRDLDLDAGMVRVCQQAVKVGSTYVLTQPKTAAGVRSVAIPPQLLPGLRQWLSAQPVAGRDGLLFVGQDGGPMSASTLRDAHVKGRDAIGKPDLTVHGLRHTGLTLAGQAGATLPELMARAGHTTPTMVLKYQHASAVRDVEIAARMAALA